MSVGAWLDFNRGLVRVNDKNEWFCKWMRLEYVSIMVGVGQGSGLEHVVKFLERIYEDFR